MDAPRPLTDNTKLINVTYTLIPGNKRRDIRCCYCGLVIMQDKKNVKDIIEGRVLEVEDNAQIIRCARCNTVFCVINL